MYSVHARAHRGTQAFMQAWLHAGTKKMHSGYILHMHTPICTCAELSKCLVHSPTKLNFGMASFSLTDILLVLEHSVDSGVSHPIHCGRQPVDVGAD